MTPCERRCDTVADFIQAIYAVVVAKTAKPIRDEHRERITKHGVDRRSNLVKFVAACLHAEAGRLFVSPRPAAFWALPGIHLVVTVEIISRCAFTIAR